MLPTLKITAAVIYLITVVILSACGASMDMGLPLASREAVYVTKDYPAVVGISNGTGYCTGTFVSENAILTAAHCTQENGRYTIYSQFGYHYSYNKVNLGSGDVNDPNDVSIIYLNNPVADASKNQIIPIGNQVATGDTVRLLGNGCTNWSTMTGIDGQTRTGTNVVYRISNYLEFYAPLNANSGFPSRGLAGSANLAVACPGDSGGPALRQGDGNSIVGVAHSGGVGQYIQSNYANMMNPTIRDFINSVNNQYQLNIYFK
jgi:V8-like Glu-specific endopeptidase